VPEPIAETQPDHPDTRLKPLLIDGLTNGEGLPLSPEFWNELKRDAAQILPGHK
jgi:hypothetical protein